MQGQARIAVLIALGAGLVTAYGVGNFIREQKAAVDELRLSTQNVVVATREIPIGTMVTEDMLRVVAYPKSTLPEGYFGTTAPVVGKTVGFKIVTGEPVLASRFSEQGGALTARLEPGYRAVAVKVNEVIGVSGFLAPNDRVDVIANVDAERETGKAGKVSKVVLQDRRVLSVAQTTDRAPDGKPVIASSITLEVTPDEGEKLSLATGGGEVVLALRGADDRTVVQTKGSTLKDFLPAPPPAVAARQRKAQAPKVAYAVEVYQGGKQSISSF